jgi:hypothetical protein
LCQTSCIQHRAGSPHPLTHGESPWWRSRSRSWWSGLYTCDRTLGCQPRQWLTAIARSASAATTGCGIIERRDINRKLEASLDDGGTSGTDPHQEEAAAFACQVRRCAEVIAFIDIEATQGRCRHQTEAACSQEEI